MGENNRILLGSTFSCRCGKNHTVPTEQLFYGEDAYESLLEVAGKRALGKKRVLIIADKRTFEAAGRHVLKVLQPIGPSLYIVEDRGGETPAADDATKDIIIAESPPADLYIAVGSGVINDLVKWVSFLKQKPYITVPTAASMNGYASANVAAAIGGLKMLFHAEACKTVHVDPRVLINAPFELTTSGLGDVLAKSVSSADWKLNHYLFDEYYCQYSVDLLKDLEPIYLENPENIKNRDPEAIKALFEALFYSSIAMTITGTSSPASGGEHLISHTLDMLADRDSGLHDLHGRQVGVASILAAALYEKVMSIEEPVFHDVPESIDADFWGSLSPVVEKEYQKKKEKFKSAAAFLSVRRNWAELREKIQPGLVQPEKLKRCLLTAGAAHRFCDIRHQGHPLDKDKFLRVVLNANQMRERFTILDLAILLGVLPGELEDIVAKWVL